MRRAGLLVVGAGLLSVPALVSQVAWLQSPIVGQWSVAQLTGLGCASLLALLVGFDLGQVRGRQSAGAAGTVIVPPLEEVSEQMLREFSRARRFERPLSVVVIKEARRPGDLSRLMHGLAALGMRDIDVWGYDASREELVVLAPETTRGAAVGLVRRLKAGLGSLAGIGVDSYIATFPGDGMTLDGLFEACRTQQAATGPAEIRRQVRSQRPVERGNA